MGMLIAAYSFSRGLVNPVSFNVAIIAVVLLTMVSPLLIKALKVERRKEEMVVPSSFTGDEKRHRLFSRNR
jgi:hypothetical protein